MSSHAVTGVPSTFAKSADWMLVAIDIDAGFNLTIEYSPFIGGAETSDDSAAVAQIPRYRITFGNPVAWAFVELAWMLQYFPEFDCPPVIQEIDRDGDHVFIRGFSIHKEAHGDDWRRFRLTICDEVFEIVSATGPQIEALQ